jgi:exopolysaccharide biosynthesis polyprenyl glycosylphosphotransferase
MRLFGHWLAPARAKLFAVEQAILGIVFLAVEAAAGRSGAEALGLSFGLTAATQLPGYLADLYVPRERFPEVRWLLSVGLGTLLATALWGLSGASAGGLWLAALVGASASLVLSRAVVLHPPQRALVLGTGPKARHLLGLAQDLAESARIVAFIADGRRDEPAPTPAPLIVAPNGPFEEIAQRVRADLLIVATEQAGPEPLLARARALGLEVISAAEFCARHLRRIPPELLAPSELAFGEGFHAPRWYDAAQRFIDLVAASLLLVLSSPLLLTAMLAVKIDSPGRIFYSQDRVGRGGRVYRVTKLRTMRSDAEAAGRPVWATHGDPRITRIGRLLRLTRVDELPQLFAVFRGDMSLVGPRPERPFFVDQLKDQLPLYELREAVRPGLTGWAQLCYPYGATIEDARAKLEYDLYFIRHRSPFLVCSILFHTARTVLTGKGAR